jgi:small GTP-binding protein
MVGIQEKIKEIEDELARTQKNKATEWHIAIQKAKLAKLRAQLIAGPKGGASGGGFDVRKSGDARVIMVGYPSTGKSTLLSKVTKAESKQAAYAFTTLDVIPGLIEYKGAKIQFLDVPGILRGAARGLGRGKEVLAVARSADLILIFVDVFNPDTAGLVEELYEVGIRIDTTPPDVVISKQETGGIVINRIKPTRKLTDKSIVDILGVYGVHSATVTIRDDIDTDEFIDVIVGNRIYTKSLKVVNKIDMVDKKKLKELEKKIGPFIGISAQEGINIELLKEKMYDKLDLIRVYTKTRFGETDDEPLVIKNGSTIRQVCMGIHRDMVRDFKFALVNGPSAKWENQRVGLNHRVKDGDLVQIFTR